MGAAVPKVLTIQDLTVSFGHRPLFHQAHLQVEQGERVALVGRNGTGKSTLLKVIAGLAEPDGGTVALSKGVVVSLLTQAVPVTLTGTVYDVVSTGLSNAGNLLKKYFELMQRLAIEVDDQLLAEQAQLSSQIEAENAWIYQQRIEEIVSKLGLNGYDDVLSLSGGVKRRVLLAKALVNDPDILLLDEPTNHLDVDAIDWLEAFFKKYNKTLIFITHDRNFLRALATRIVEIDYQSIFSWPGDYDQYCKLKSELVHAQAKEQALFNKKLSQEEVWIRQGIKARRTRNEGRVRRLEAMREEKALQFKQKGQAKFEIESDRRSGKLVFELDHVTFSYQEKNIVTDFTALVARGDRVGIVGPNGAGKSTVIKLLLGQLLPDVGSITQGTNLDIAYFDQYRFLLDENLNAVDNVGQGREFITVNGKEKHVISYLQDFMFSPERARQKVSVFSGGEKNRLLLAKLFSQPANLIIMDEPTNDLDIETLELLEEKLLGFSGTLLVVSHDRAFLDNVTTQLWVLGEKGHIQEYVGGYSQWQAQVATQAVEQKSQVPSSSGSSKNNAAIGKWTQKTKKELAAIPAKITKVEEALEQMQEEAMHAEFYQQSPGVIKAHSEKVTSLENELEQLYERWQELEGLKG